jgi:hypothetical protein
MEGGSPGKIVITQLPQAKLILQRLLLLLRPRCNHLIHILNNGLNIATTIPRHRQLDRHEVLPVIADGLHGRTARMVRPEGAGARGLSPRGQRARVGAADHDPGRGGGVAAVRRVEGEARGGGNADEVGDGVAEGEETEVVAGEIVVGGGFAPVAVCGGRLVTSDFVWGEVELLRGRRTLNDHSSALDLLRQPSRQRCIGEVPAIMISGNLARREEDDG